MSLFIGCDPGLTGALSLIDRHGVLLECADVPTCDNGLASGSMKRWVDVRALAAMLRDWSARHHFAKVSVQAAIERPIPMPTLPAQTIASQFDTFGTIRAEVARIADEGVQFVAPQAWKKLFGVGNDKDAARQCCLRLYPEAPVTRVKDHNRAEAILVAHWLRREFA